MKKKQTRLLLLGAGGIALIWFAMHDSSSAPVVIPGSPADTGTNTGVVPPGTPDSPVVVPVSNLPALDTVASNNRAVLLRDAAAYPAIIAALQQMNSQEIYTAYQFFYNYLLPGLKLYRNAGTYSDGGWNTQLYDAVNALHVKYGIF